MLGNRVGISRMRRKSRVEKHRPGRKCYARSLLRVKNEHNQNNLSIMQKSVSIMQCFGGNSE